MRSGRGAAIAAIILLSPFHLLPYAKPYLSAKPFRHGGLDGVFLAANRNFREFDESKLNDLN